jgi:hypothetical protein
MGFYLNTPVDCRKELRVLHASQIILYAPDSSRTVYLSEPSMSTSASFHPLPVRGTKVATCPCPYRKHNSTLPTLSLHLGCLPYSVLLSHPSRATDIHEDKSPLPSCVGGALLPPHNRATAAENIRLVVGLPCRRRHKHTGPPTLVSTY